MKHRPIALACALAVVIAVCVLLTMQRVSPRAVEQVSVVLTPLPIAGVSATTVPNAGDNIGIDDLAAMAPAELVMDVSPAPASGELTSPIPEAGLAMATDSPAPTPVQLPAYTADSAPYSDATIDIATAYRTAVIDAMLAEPDEICELVCLTSGDERVTFDESGRVLLIAPQSISEGKPIGLTRAFSERELAMRMLSETSEPASLRELDLRLRELMGLPLNDDALTLTALWVDVADVFRPAYSTDTCSEVDSVALAETVRVEYAEWFNARIIEAYYPLNMPWTRLGYSYDWNPDMPEYGLSEFMVVPSSAIKVEYELDALTWMEHISQ